MGMKLSDVTLAEIGVVDAPSDADFDHITDFVADLADAPVALVSIVEPDKDRQFFKAARGLPEPWRSRRETPLSHSFCKHVQASGEPLIVEDSRQHPLVRENPAVEELNVAAYLGVPIRGVSGEPIGALCAIDTAPRAWPDQQVATLQKLAKLVNDQIQLRAALRVSEHQLDTLAEEISARSVAEAELLRLATTDPLTDALNRRAFMDRAKLEIARLRRNQEDAAVLLLDLDHFKQVNDTHGHDAGDMVLKVFAGRLGIILRAELDVIARFGGEEFVLLLSGADRDSARVVADRCRSAMAESPIVLGNGVSLLVTVSCGTAQLRECGLDLELALKWADEALYQAKAYGRNRVVQSAPYQKQRQIV